MNRIANNANQIFGLCLLGILLFTLSSSVHAQRYSGRYVPRVRSLSITGEGGIAVLGCDLTSLDDNYNLEPFGGIEFGYMAARNFKIGLFTSRGLLAAEDNAAKAENTFIIAGLTGHYYFRMSWGRINPYLVFRLGGIFSEAESLTSSSFQTKTANGFLYGGGIGIEFHPSRVVGIRIQSTGMLTTSDDLDAIVAGNMADGFTTLSVGISYYFIVRR
jgi:outer membrane protein W